MTERTRIQTRENALPRTQDGAKTAYLCRLFLCLALSLCALGLTFSVSAGAALHCLCASPFLFLLALDAHRRRGRARRLSDEADADYRRALDSLTRRSKELRGPGGNAVVEAAVGRARVLRVSTAKRLRSAVLEDAGVCCSLPLMLCVLLFEKAASPGLLLLWAGSYAFFLGEAFSSLLDLPRSHKVGRQTSQEEAALPYAVAETLKPLLAPGGRVSVGAEAEDRAALVRALGVNVSNQGRPAVLVVRGTPWLRRAATVRENIAYGRPGAAVEEVSAAARLCGLEEAIHRLPSGLNTRVREALPRLSPAERQQLVLARALVARPALLILDGALSALDNAAYDRVLSALSDALPDSAILLLHSGAVLPPFACRRFTLENGALHELPAVRRRRV